MSRGTRRGTSPCYDERSGALFSGDCVQGSVYLGLDGTPKLCPTYTDVDPYLQTIDRVEALAPSELHGCHWPVAVAPRYVHSSTRVALT